MEYLKKAVEESIRVNLRTNLRESASWNIFVPENEKFGHYSTNVALKLAKEKSKKPMEVAEDIKDKMLSFDKLRTFGKIEIASPGFINFWLSEKTLQNELKEILKKRNTYGKVLSAKRKASFINVEFISANPTGPLTIGNGRGGFFGDVLANILKFSGHKVIKEYYINDAKNSTQIRELGKTGLGLGETYLTPGLKKIILRLKGKIKKVTLRPIRQAQGKHTQGASRNLDGEVGYLLAGEINKQNKKFVEKVLKIKFDKWFSEESLYKSGAVKKLLNDLKKENLVYEKDGALWFKAKQFGDTEDRVLIRSARSTSSGQGEPTYILPDLAYHLNKFKIRKFSKAVDVWGADHHGYIPRLKAGLKALGISEGRLRIIITQLVRLVKNGQEYKMSKRKGDYVAMEDLIKEVGLDAARFFFLMSAPDTHMNFDLDLAKEKSMKNPVYYAQYAAVRCNSILQKTKKLTHSINSGLVLREVEGLKNIKTKSKANLDLLNTKEDLNLMRILVRFPEIVEEATENYNPQVLVRYSIDLARQFHNFYEKERIIGVELDLMLARLEIIKAAKTIFETLFKLLGISYPKKM